MQIFAEHTIKIVVQHILRNEKRLSQNLVQGCVKTWSKHVAQYNWTNFLLKKRVTFVFFSFRVFEKLILPAERRGFMKNKKEK